MVQSGPLRRAHRLSAINLASPTKKARPYAVERGPVAWHTNDGNMNAEASEEASASSTVANTSEPTILPIRASRHLLHQPCSISVFPGVVSPLVPSNRTLSRVWFRGGALGATTTSAQAPAPTM